MDGDNPDQVIRILNDHGPEAVALSDHFGHTANGIRFLLAEGKGIDALFCDYNELHQVEGVRTFPQDATLRPALPAIF
jgi:hypothetical protein